MKDKQSCLNELLMYTPKDDPSIDGYLYRHSAVLVYRPPIEHSSNPVLNAKLKIAREILEENEYIYRPTRKKTEQTL